MSKSFYISIEFNPSPEDIQVLGNGITEYAALKTQHQPMEFFAVVLRDQNQSICGGTNGSIMYGCLHIDQLWVSPTLRSQGYGRQLMTKALEFGVAKQCSFATVNTMDWEALEFYQKLGFEIEFKRTGFDHQSIFYFLRKSLRHPLVNQKVEETSHKNLATQIRPVHLQDVPQMVALSKAKRLAYEKIQPQFWRHHPLAESEQTQWFKTLLNQPQVLMFVAECQPNIIGFIIGILKQAPAVYQPGGLTLEVDDFCVQNEQWSTIGLPLLSTVKQHAKKMGAVQCIVVCGAEDRPKKQCLTQSGLIIASKWFVASL